MPEDRAHEARQLGKIATTSGGVPIGRIIGFSYEGSFAIIDFPEGVIALCPIKWVCPICKAERGTGANTCRLCGAYLKAVQG